MIKVTVRVDRWIKKEIFSDAVVTKTRTTTHKLFDAFVLRSPVYTGSYRASWRIAFDTPDPSITDGGGPAAPLPPPKFQWPPGFKVGMQVIISNNQPYAERIEYGWSQQAPHGVVRTVVASYKILQ